MLKSFIPAILRAISERSKYWAVNALVVATAISVPALMYNTLPASLAIEEPTTLTIANVSIPSLLVILRASKVSAVSPDCEINTTNVSLS